MTPQEIVAHIAPLGIRRLIVLDIARVGSETGVTTTQLCHDILARHARLQIISGGGVRGPADLKSLADCGCQGALVATTLHNGNLTQQDIVDAASW